MPNFGTESKKQLATCHPDLVKVLNEAIKYFDFSVLEGHRGQAAQEKAFKDGNSKVRWPFGKHNSNPSLAADCAPFPIDWKDTERFVFMQGVIYASAKRLGITIRQGIDWNSNNRMLDEIGLHDYPHVELVK